MALSPALTIATRPLRFRRYRVAPAHATPGSDVEVAAPGAWQALLAAAPLLGLPPQDLFAVPAS